MKLKKNFNGLLLGQRIPFIAKDVKHSKKREVIYDCVVYVATVIVNNAPYKRCLGVNLVRKRSVLGVNLLTEL